MLNDKVLIVDDEDNMRSALLEIIKRGGYDAIAAKSGKEALGLISGNSFASAIVDVRMPDMNGIDLLRRIKQLHPKMVVIIVTAFPDAEAAFEASQIGAVEYLTKPFSSSEKLLSILKNHLGVKLEEPIGDFQEIVTQDAKMLKILETVKQIAARNATILIRGETGTGKDLIARALHHHSPRALKGKFVPVNCPAVPAELLESQMFGHEQGAFTGATKRHTGKFEQAHGGTLFLDEIGDLSPELQAKLLRVLQDKVIEPVGGREGIQVDVRILASTNANLEAKRDAGEFREDLYYRLDVIQIHLPPLRERDGDIPLLAKHFLKIHSEEEGKSFLGFTPEAMDMLCAYHWPGNVRHLQHIIESAVILCPDKYISPEWVEPERRKADRRKTQSNGLVIRIGQTTMYEAEKGIILKTLEYFGDNKTKTAESLEITARTIRNKLRNYREETEDVDR